MQQQSPWLAAGRYEVGEVVGRGGYGMVCRGLDRKTGLRVALKMLSPEAGRDPDVVERMLREQQALVALTGTCAVTAIDLCRLESGAPCLVMEWLDGRDLENQLTVWEAAGQRGSIEMLRGILKPLCATLERAHDIGIVHRDIKPANVFLVEGPTANVRLLDFGLSRMKSAAPLTAVGMVMGSPSYIAPETWRGNSTALDGRADLFALAVIVFRYLTGQLPFEAPDLIAKMTAVTSGPRPSVVARRPELPAALDAWMSRALAVEAADRFQSGGELFLAFEAALRGDVVAASADISGVRAVAKTDVSDVAGDRKGALASAWRAAASLLKHFTAPKERITPDPVPPSSTEAPPTVVTPTTLAEEAPPSERKSVWLDPEELQDLTPEEAPHDASPMTLRSERPPPPRRSTVAPPPRSAPPEASSEQRAASVEARPEVTSGEEPSGKSKRERKHKSKRKAQPAEAKTKSGSKKGKGKKRERAKKPAR
jgi:eukaryotic-like serine/threonine-protein kinase